MTSHSPHSDRQVQPEASGHDRDLLYLALLFRNGVDSYFAGANPKAAPRTTLDASLLRGLDILCDGHLGFVNCPCGALLQDYPILLPSNRTIVEVLENVPADSEVIAACQRLRICS